MTRELNMILGKNLDEVPVRDFKPTTCEPNGYLRLVVTPLYKIVEAVSCSFVSYFLSWVLRNGIVIVVVLGLLTHGTMLS